MNRPYTCTCNVSAKWIDSEFKILEVNFQQINHEQLSTLNFANRIQELKAVVNVWS